MNTKKILQPELAKKAVDAIEGAVGKFPSYRRAHAKGSYYRAVFTPNGNASSMTTAPHLQNTPVPALVRFSNGSPNPHVADILAPVKGMAVQFQLPDGSVTNMATVTIPIFFAKTPQAFIELLQSFKPDPTTGAPDQSKIQAVLEKYPESKPGLMVAKSAQSPASFATADYFAIHAFYFINAEGKRQAVRYQFVPDTGVQMLSKEEAEERAQEYLTGELEERLAQGPIGFNLCVQIGQEEDPTNDSTVAWQEDRETIVIGHLSITDIVEDQEENVVFDPTIVPEGIECSEDPVLNFRRAAYADSFGRRNQNL
ncbi:catalase family peroxidase [Priestia megaterium]|nr:catalase family peroxidase [Priestia megaterium]